MSDRLDAYTAREHRRTRRKNDELQMAYEYATGVLMDVYELTFTDFLLMDETERRPYFRIWESCIEEYLANYYATEEGEK